MQKRDTMASTNSTNVTMTAPYCDGPRLLADIGGTNARFALEYGPGQIDDIQVLACADHAEFAGALDAYLQQVQISAVRHAAIAIANPVIGDAIHMTNHHWKFSIEETRRRFGFETLLATNDFTALANALPYLGRHELIHVGGDATASAGPLGLIGAGTGLGVGGLIPTDDGNWVALKSEGGHTTFAPADALEAAILDYSWRIFPHVSFERFVSGPGIELIYRALGAIKAYPVEELGAAAIITRAVSIDDVLCRQTVDRFCAMLGTVASNLAITLGAQGGVYIGGGIVPRLGDLFTASPFRARFENKGRLGAYLAQVPTWVISAPYPAFVGIGAMLERQLARSTPVAPVLHDEHAALRICSEAR
jgi:glucokinase